jgi:hypothetical protein
MIDSRNTLQIACHNTRNVSGLCIVDYLGSLDDSRPSSCTKSKKWNFRKLVEGKKADTSQECPGTNSTNKIGIVYAVGPGCLSLL